MIPIRTILLCSLGPSLACSAAAATQIGTEAQGGSTDSTDAEASDAGTSDAGISDAGSADAESGETEEGDGESGDETGGDETGGMGCKVERPTVVPVIRRFEGSEADQHLWVSGFGDINGDGREDFYYANCPDGACVLTDLGGRETVSAVDIASLDGLVYVHDKYESDGPECIPSAVPLGDVNGDCFDDVGIRQWCEPDDYENARFGPMHVLLGGEDPLVKSFSIDVQAHYYAGYSFSNVGDFTGDGINDIGVRFFNRGMGGGGRIHVVPGAADGSDLSLTIPDPTGERLVISGYALACDSPAQRVQNAGDVNGDGLDDIAILTSGDCDESDTPSGLAVVFGGAQGSLLVADPYGAATDPNIADGSDPRGVHLGFELGYGSVASGRDLNGDGHPDFLVYGWLDGATKRARVLLGGPSLVGGELANLPDSAFGFEITDLNPTSVYTFDLISDFSGDGRDDIVVGVGGEQVEGATNVNGQVRFLASPSGDTVSFNDAYDPCQVGDCAGEMDELVWSGEISLDAGTTTSYLVNSPEATVGGLSNAGASFVLRSPD